MISGKTQSGTPKKILVCRRDNIGDLVLTTPLIAAIIQGHPEALVDVLVHSYTKEVLEPFPGVRNVFAYTKAKHASGLIQKLRVLKNQLALYWSLRQGKYDWLVLVDDVQKEKNRWLFAVVRPGCLFALDDQRLTDEKTLLSNVQLSDGLKKFSRSHETLRALSLVTLLPGMYRAEVPKIYLSRQLKAVAPVFTVQAGPDSSHRFHIHLSARRVKQRWGVDRYVDLTQALLRKYPSAGVSITWAPGPPDDPLHPGDDHLSTLLEKQLAEKIGLSSRVEFCRTDDLQALKGVLVSRTLSVCPDGGAMHLAAGLGVPVIALFGDSPSNRWAPTSPRSLVLQASSGHVKDIPVDSVMSAIDQVLNYSERH